MAVHKLLDDIFEHQYTLIAIHSPVKDYRLAYFLNRSLSINLKRTREDFNYIDNASFSMFHWNDESSETRWDLITNVSKHMVDSGSEDLFGANYTIHTEYLIPEHKKVDYFLKIDNGDVFCEDKTILKSINEIPHVVTAYAVDPDQLKSKNNLIFLNNA